MIAPPVNLVPSNINVFPAQAKIPSGPPPKLHSSRGKSSIQLNILTTLTFDRMLYGIVLPKIFILYLNFLKSNIKFP